MKKQIVIFSCDRVLEPEENLKKCFDMTLKICGLHGISAGTIYNDRALAGADTKDRFLSVLDGLLPDTMKLPVEDRSYTDVTGAAHPEKRHVRAEYFYDIYTSASRCIGLRKGLKKTVSVLSERGIETAFLIDPLLWNRKRQTDRVLEMDPSYIWDDPSVRHAEGLRDIVEMLKSDGIRPENTLYIAGDIKNAEDIYGYTRWNIYTGKCITTDEVEAVIKTFLKDRGAAV